MNAGMLDALGWAQYKNGQHAQAAISVGEALRKAPHEPLILSHAAIIAYALGKKEQAREYAALSAAPLTLSVP
jgi:Flp pilus assembly protein TadD